MVNFNTLLSNAILAFHTSIEYLLLGPELCPRCGEKLKYSKQYHTKGCESCLYLDIRRAIPSQF